MFERQSHHYIIVIYLWQQFPSSLITYVMNTVSNTGQFESMQIIRIVSVFAAFGNVYKPCSVQSEAMALTHFRDDLFSLI